jgi:Holliday junction resolvase-like predicted endonuclease
MSTLRVEEDWTEVAKEYLRANGFKNIVRMPRYSLYDFMCEKDGKICFVEMKTRSAKAKTQLFVVKEKKLRRLLELQENTNCPVYLLFINKNGKWLLRLDDFLHKLKASTYPLLMMENFSVATSAKIVKAYFQQTERITRREYEYKNKNEKDRMRLVIWCSEETRKKFRRYVLENDFRNMEDALVFLLQKASELNLKPAKGRAF